MVSRKQIGQGGFTLIEIMIALTIFAVFIAVYVTSQGGNLADSQLLREEIMLRNLAEEYMNEVVTTPPELKDSLTLSKDTGNFDKYPGYEHTAEWKKFVLPNLSQGGGEEGGEEGGEADTSEAGPEANKAQGAQTQIFNKLKENMQKLIWQLKVTVRNKETGFSYSISTWLLNEKAEVKIDGF